MGRHCCRRKRSAAVGSAPDELSREASGPELCRFLDAGNNEALGTLQLTGVQKAPRHEVAGSWAPAGPRALWGFDVSADLDGGRNTARKRPGCVDRRGGSLQWASRQARAAHKRALGALIAVIGSREITAGVEPAHRNVKVATLTVGLSHEVSTLLGIGRHLGSQPRANN